MNIDRKFILEWLYQDDQTKLEELWQMADICRKKHVGDAVHLRGLIEVRNCTYCGLRFERSQLQRYRMSKTEILESARKAVQLGYGTVVLQGGEDYGIGRDWLSDLIVKIKKQTDLAVTLSMGERPLEDIQAWRSAGADRYLLRFETSDTELYKKIHPSLPKDQMGRIELLKKIKQLGYETGSGVMIGIPGQSYQSLVDDIQLFKHLDLDMIGVGPYISHSQTPLYSLQNILPDQVPNTEQMVYKVIALSRLICPDVNIPGTTALATINKDSGRENSLRRGANVVMPNLTPVRYRKFYEIYPAKVCINEDADDCSMCIKGRIFSIERVIGKGQGSRFKENRK